VLGANGLGAGFQFSRGRTALHLAKEMSIVLKNLGDVGVVGAESFFQDGKCPPEERLSIGQPPHLVGDQGKGVEAVGYRRVLGTKEFLLDGERLPTNGLSFGVFALDAINLSEVGETGGEVRVLGAEGLPFDG